MFTVGNIFVFAPSFFFFFYIAPAAPELVFIAPSESPYVRLVTIRGGARGTRDPDASWCTVSVATVGDTFSCGKFIKRLVPSIAGELRSLVKLTSVTECSPNGGN